MKFHRKTIALQRIRLDDKPENPSADSIPQITVCFIKNQIFSETFICISSIRVIFLI